MVEDTDSETYKGAGMLTETQRKYLNGVSDVEPKTQHERTIRSRIRERVANSIWDLLYIAQGLQERDIEKIATEKVELKHTSFGREILGILLLFVEDLRIELGDEKSIEEFTEKLEGIMSQAIDSLLFHRGYTVENCSVNVDLDIGTEFDSLAEEPLESLSDGELMQLSNSGEGDLGEILVEMHERDMLVTTEMIQENPEMIQDNQEGE